MSANYSKNFPVFFIKLLFLCVVTSTSVAAEVVRGKVISIADGDTITMLVDQKQIKVRLAEVDTPESGQPYGNRAKKNLSNLVFGKNVLVSVVDIDRYGRSVGKVYVDDVYVNAELIRTGSAWVYRKYSSDKSLLVIEQQARNRKLGLWALPEAERVPPWEWRNGKNLSSQSLEKQKPNTNIRCGEKKFCRQMSSCEEAKIYLHQCHLSRLDGDGDGTPCENLCR